MAVEPPKREPMTVPADGDSDSDQQPAEGVRESATVSESNPEVQKIQAKVQIIRNDEDDSEWSNQDDSYD